MAGVIVAFVACLMAAELVLGDGSASHAMRVVLLGVLTLSTVALSVMLPQERRVLHPAEARAAARAFGGPPASVVPIEGAVQISI